MGGTVLVFVLVHVGIWTGNFVTWNYTLSELRTIEFILLSQQCRELLYVHSIWMHVGESSHAEYLNKLISYKFDCKMITEIPIASEKKCSELRLTVFQRNQSLKHEVGVLRVLFKDISR